MSDEAEPQKKAKSDYRAAPTVPPEVEPLLAAFLAVQTKQMSVTEAAKLVGLSRNRFQSLMHRGLSGLLKELAQKPAGRPSKPESEVKLEQQVARLTKENAYLTERVETVDRLLGVASELVRGKLTLKGRGRQTGAKKSPEPEGETAEEPDGAARRRLEGVESMRQLGVTVALAAALVDSSPSTLRRHAARERDGEPLVRPRGPCHQGPATVEQRASCSGLVRQMHGLIGADALSHSVAGLSRRKAAAIKSETLTQMERERLASCQQVVIPTLGVVRGFDAMHVSTIEGWRYLLAAADASIPYRTMLAMVGSYDSSSVAMTLELDILLNGAPLVYRFDRAKCHRTAEVREVLNRHEVLVLQGPPRHPRYYGQLERQNREHRAWLNECGELTPQQLETEAQRMRHAWNCTLPRRTLTWQTAEQVWKQRTVPAIDRRALREEVTDRAARIQRQLDVRGVHADLAERLAIEATLTKHGWLVRRGGEIAKCLA